MKTTVILGAGFSKNSGIPIQSEIPELLVTYGENDGFENSVSIVLQTFMKDVFGYSGGSSLPNLDDIFTCIDISTNSGHHLGIKYSPLKLRSIRRFLVYRVFSILENSFKQDDNVGSLLNVLNRGNINTRYVVLNWDNVLEKYLEILNRQIYIDYCNEGMNWGENGKHSEENTIKIIKLHGSCNWLYCDNCRALYNDIGDSVTLIERAGFQENDLLLLGRFPLSKGKILKSRLCDSCSNEISSHIATFSYRKTFRANSFPNIWSEAEKVLCDSDRWVFIGYSLPDADYEFKHLLKISELKLQHMRKDRLKIDVVLLDSDKAIDKYKSFFGDKLNHMCNEGIKEYLNYRISTTQYQYHT